MLFSRIEPKASIRKDQDYVSGEIWTALHERDFKEVIGRISVENLQRRLDTAFVGNAGRAADLFSTRSSEVLHTGITSAGTRDDPPYGLVLAIDEWGLMAAKEDREDGPYILLTMQLIDRATNASLWKYSQLFQEPVDKDAGTVMRADLLEDVYKRLIVRAVDQYFVWLND